jgi:hypothetical protein
LYFCTSKASKLSKPVFTSSCRTSCTTRATTASAAADRFSSVSATPEV